jgi:hypothetical protein
MAEFRMSTSDVTEHHTRCKAGQVHFSLMSTYRTDFNIALGHHELSLTSEFCSVYFSSTSTPCQNGWLPILSLGLSCYGLGQGAWEYALKRLREAQRGAVMPFLPITRIQEFHHPKHGFEVASLPDHSECLILQCLPALTSQKPVSRISMLPRTPDSDGGGPTSASWPPPLLQQAPECRPC